jgi:PadR family transcriptional regulator, regulatory protein PadR
MANDPQLLKGVLSLLLLRLLADAESYGYQIVQRLRDAGLPEISEGTVYPALARLEREERITARLVPSSSGPARKYYRLSPAGYRALGDGHVAWQALVDVVGGLFALPVPAEPASPATE